MDNPSPRTPLLLIALTALLATGCSTPPSARDYTHGTSLRAQTVHIATVVSVQPVHIRGNAGTGRVAGAVGGGVAGHAMSNGNPVATVVGTLAGGYAGQEAQRHAESANGYQITVRFKDGRTFAITQEADLPFKKGEKVQVVGPPNNARVQKL